MKNTILKVLQQTDYDRYVFLTYANDEIIGLNFWQGIGKESFDNVMTNKGYEPCIHLTDIYNRLKNSHNNDNDKKSIRISKAISLFIDAFIIQDCKHY
jgi:hypothetical protein